MEIRRFVVSDPVGEEPEPSSCVDCEGGPVDATDRNQVCRECGALNGTGTHYVKRGFTFKFRIGTGATLDIRVRRRDTENPHARLEEEYILLMVKG